MVLRSAEAGTLDPATAQLVTRSLGFAERTAADVMTPRVRCTPVQREESAARVIELCRETGHSRFPVVEDDLDHVIGVVHIKKAVSVPYERRDDVPAGALMVDTLVVPESIRLDPLLAQLREQGLQMAIVVDEYGGTSGVVTLEDVVEELVGEVADEHDRVRQSGRRLRDGSWVVPGPVAAGRAERAGRGRGARRRELRDGRRLPDGPPGPGAHGRRRGDGRRRPAARAADGRPPGRPAALPAGHRRRRRPDCQGRRRRRAAA